MGVVAHAPAALVRPSHTSAPGRRPSPLPTSEPSVSRRRKSTRRCSPLDHLLLPRPDANQRLVLFLAGRATHHNSLFVLFLEAWVFLGRRRPIRQALYTNPDECVVSSIWAYVPVSDEPRHCRPSRVFHRSVCPSSSRSRVSDDARIDIVHRMLQKLRNGMSPATSLKRKAARGTSNLE